MSTPDTSIYIVGTNRTWQIRAKTLKLILTSTVLLLIGLAAALLYQSIWHLQVVGGWEERYAAENERNEKMRSVIEDLRERVVDRGTLEMRQAIYSNGPDPEELLQKNQRQQETIEAQQLRIEQLQSETNDQQIKLLELDVQLTDEIPSHACAASVAATAAACITTCTTIISTVAVPTARTTPIAAAAITVTTTITSIAA